jgi:hypothetical protein
MSIWVFLYSKVAFVLLLMNIVVHMEDFGFFAEIDIQYDTTIQAFSLS